MAANLTARAPLALLLFSSVVFAQWGDYPAKNVPRNAEGKVVMTAPPPRTADGKIDLSGIWNYRGRPPKDLEPSKGAPIATFANVGAGYKEGLPLRPIAAQLLAARHAENSKDNPDAHCLPLGLTQLHLHPQPNKIIQTPGVIVILYEAQGGVRQIFTDGRPLPDPKEIQPWWYGYSVGHWEGDTLVVETVGFRDDVWLDIWGTPLTNEGKMTERFRRPSTGILEIEVTVEDPSAYTKPFTFRINQFLQPDTDLIEFVCNENDRSGPHLVGQ